MNAVADWVTTLIKLRNANTTWRDCAAQLGKPIEELRALAKQLREAGEWKLPNGQLARGASTAGLSGRPMGRPRNEVPTVCVSPRFAPDVSIALREVANTNGLRVGNVVSWAMASLSLPKCKPRRVLLGLRTEVVSVRVPSTVYNAFMSTREGRPLTLIAAACEQMLRELGYELVKP